MPILEDPCEACDGTGEATDAITGMRMPCPDCLGTGRDR